MTQRERETSRKQNIILIGALLVLGGAVLVYLVVRQGLMEDEKGHISSTEYMHDQQHDMSEMNHDMHGHNMLVNEEGLMYQDYFAKDHKLTPEERQQIVDTTAMPVIGATYGPCYDSDADAVHSKYYPGTTEYTYADGTVKAQKDHCIDAGHLIEYYCTRTIDNPDEYLMRSWEYACEKGCSDGACAFVKGM